jgi:hypothetical protein
MPLPRMNTRPEFPTHYDVATRLVDDSTASTLELAQVHATLAVADKLEALTERLESILDAGLSNISENIVGGA